MIKDFIGCFEAEAKARAIIEFLSDEVAGSL